MKRDKNAIFKVRPNSEIIYAIQKRGLFHTYVQFYDITDTIDGKKRPVIYYRLVRNCKTNIKLCEAMRHRHHDDLLAVSVKIANSDVDELLQEIKHAYKYIELNYPNHILVQLVNEERSRQKLIRYIYSGAKFGDPGE